MSSLCYLEAVLDTHTCNVSVTVVVTVHGVLSSQGCQWLSLHSVMNKVKTVKGEKLILYLNMNKIKPTKWSQFVLPLLQVTQQTRLQSVRRL